MPLSIIGRATEQQLLASELVLHGCTGFIFGKGITFTSGIKSPGVYGDCRKALSHHYLRKLILDQYRTFVFKDSFRSDRACSFIAGVETGGIGFGALLAHEAGLPYIGVRKAAKGHGDTSWFSGDTELVRGKQGILVEDMTTTAGSLLRAGDTLREKLDAHADDALSVFSYNFPEMILATDAAGMQVRTLCTFDRMLDYAVSGDHDINISPEYKAVIEKWLENPRDESWVTDEWKF